MAQRLRHHRPLRGRQGHADPRAAASASRSSSCRSRPPRAQPRPGRARRRRLPLPHRRGVRPPRRRRATSSSTPPTPAAATARCAPSSSGGSAAGRPGACSRSRSRARARCATRCPRRVQVFIAPPSLEALRDAAGRPRHRRPRADRARACASPSDELTAQDEFAHVVVNDRLEDAVGLERSWRSSYASIGCRAAATTPDAGPSTHDHPPHRQAARARRLQLRLRARGRQARPADQLLLPQPRRGDVRRVPAADGRDRARRTTSRSPSRRSPRARSSTTTGRDVGRARHGPASCSASAAGSPPTRRSSSCAWPPRPGTPSGSCRRPRAQRFVGARLVRGAHRRAGADRRVRARPRARRLPRPARRRSTTRSATSSWSRNADALLIAPASRQHDRQARRRPRRQPADQRRAGRAPARCSSRPAMNNHMYEHPATQANLAPLRERGVTVHRARAPARWRPAASGASGAWPSRAELLAAVEAVVPAGARARGDGLRVLVTAGGTREPIDAVRYVGNRSLGPHGLRARRRGRRAAAPRSRSSPPTSRLPRTAARRATCDVGDRGRAAAPPARREFADADVLLMAAAVADFRPAEAADAASSRRTRPRRARRSRSSPPRTCSPALAAARRPGQTLVGFAAEHGEGAVAYGRDKLERKGLDAIVVNDISRPASASTPPRTRSRSSPPPASAACRGPRRPRSRARSSTWSSGSRTESEEHAEHGAIEPSRRYRHRREEERRPPCAAGAHRRTTSRRRRRGPPRAARPRARRARSPRATS